MGFKNKTLAFRVVQVGSEGWEREQALLPKLADLDKQPKPEPVVMGWAAWRHARHDATGDTAQLCEGAGVEMLQLVAASKKVPPSLLATELAQAAEKQEKDTGSRMTCKQAKASKQNIAEKLRDEAQISYAALELAWIKRGLVELGLTTAVSDSNQDTLRACAAGLKLVVNPVTAAGLLGEQVCNWKYADFAAGNSGAQVADDYLRDFLLYLMWTGQQPEGRWRTGDNGTLVVQLGFEIGGMVLVKPTDSGKMKAMTFKAGRDYKLAEVCAKLVEGYKPSRAHLLLEVLEGPGKSAKFDFEPDTWTFRGVKLVDAEDAPTWANTGAEVAARVLDGIALHETLAVLLLAFARIRSDGARWASVVESIKRWAAAETSKARTDNLLAAEGLTRKQENVTDDGTDLDLQKRAAAAKLTPVEVADALGLACEVISDTGSATEKTLMHHLKCSGKVAEMVLAALQVKGVIGPKTGSKPREIFLGKLNSVLADLKQHGSKPLGSVLGAAAACGGTVAGNAGSIEIHMDKPCSKCGKGGACGKGKGLTCNTETEEVAALSN
jgi:hypothetical protein